MTRDTGPIVLKGAHRYPSILATFIVLSLGIVPHAHGQSVFHGLYVGVDLGQQHVVAGSLVNGIDVLQEDTRAVATLSGGVRGQWRGVVIGGELGVSRVDGRMSLDDSTHSIAYDNHSQWNWTLTAGHTLGARTLIFGYVSEVTRQFDVTIRDQTETVHQEDEQGMLRIGGGVERWIRGPLRVRVTMGTSRADFGDRPTNISIGRRFEISAGLVLSF